MLDCRGPVCPVYRQKQAGVLSGSVADEENWVSDTSGTKIPLSFLKRVGIFENWRLHEQRIIWQKIRGLLHNRC